MKQFMTAKGIATFKDEGNDTFTIWDNNTKVGSLMRDQEDENCWHGDCDAGGIGRVWHTEDEDDPHFTDHTMEEIFQKAADYAMGCLLNPRSNQPLMN